VTVFAVQQQSRKDQVRGTFNCQMRCFWIGTQILKSSRGMEERGVKNSSGYSTMIKLLGGGKPMKI